MGKNNRLNLNLDATLGGDTPSNFESPSQKAIKTYTDLKVIPDSSTDISGALLPNTQYIPDLSSGGTFAITIEAPPTGKEAKYNLILNIGNTVPTFTWPSGITWEKGSAPVFDKNTKYNLTIVDNKGSYIAYGLKQSNCLTFYAGGEQTISLTNNGGNAPYLEISTDGVNWNVWNYAAVTFGTISVPMVYLRGKNPSGIGSSYSKYSTFIFGNSSRVGCVGSIMSLLDWEDELLLKVPGTLCFYRLFKDCTTIVDAPELPATIIKPYAYMEMFMGCTSLTSAPELPVLNISANGYCRMFAGCTSLTTAPELPSTKLSGSCYLEMFIECTSLVNVPELPATNLEAGCYRGMFSGCTALTSAPNLPATISAQDCYHYMFSGCVNLGEIPQIDLTDASTKKCCTAMFKGCTKITKAELNITGTLGDDALYEMFNGCTMLNEVKLLAEDISAKYCLYGWLYGVAATGTFTKKAGVTYPSGTSGIPSGWTVVEV